MEKFFEAYKMWKAFTLLKSEEFLKWRKGKIIQ